MSDLCKHCLVIVIEINYKSSLPFPQTDLINTRSKVILQSLLPSAVRHSQCL